MLKQGWCVRFVFILSAGVVAIPHKHALGQSNHKKLRMGIAATSVAARIQQQPDEVYRMVRATMRGLLFVTDEANRDQSRDVMMKQWRVSDTKLAAEMLGYLKRGLAKDAVISAEAVQYFIGLTRETSNITQPINASQVVDFSFLDKARKELRGGR